MFFWMIVKSALTSLWANKLRSVLAMLGIIIGVGAVISMLAIGAGAQQAVMNRFAALGTNLLMVNPGQRGTGGVMSGFQPLTLADAQAIVEEVPNVGMVAPVVNSQAQVKYMSRNARVGVRGSTRTYLSLRSFEVEQGRNMTEAEAEGSARVVLLGPITAQNLMGADDPIGQTVKLKGINFRIIGVLKSKSDQFDDQAIIPYTTAMKQVFGLQNINEFDIQAADEAQLSQVQADATAVLRKRHHLTAGSPDDFTVRNQAEFLAARMESSQTFTVLLGSIGAISLLVGGIGIMNIMLVTVTERTREIGVRKAIGARNVDVLLQFLFEAIIMSAVGGLIGVAVGVLSAWIIPQLSTSYTTIVQGQSIALALAFSASVGIFFGFYPARRAAQLDPIEALRYE